MYQSLKTILFGHWGIGAKAQCEPPYCKFHYFYLVADKVADKFSAEKSLRLVGNMFLVIKVCSLQLHTDRSSRTVTSFSFFVANLSVTCHQQAADLLKTCFKVSFEHHKTNGIWTLDLSCLSRPTASVNLGSSSTREVLTGPPSHHSYPQLFPSQRIL